MKKHGWLFLLAVAVMPFVLTACQNKVTNDVEVTLLNCYGEAIADTEIVIGGIDTTDLASVRTTDDEGKITLFNIGAGELTFSIVFENSSDSVRYTLSEEEVRQGRIQVQFASFGFTPDDFAAFGESMETVNLPYRLPDRADKMA